jgi:peptidase M28-like protein
MCRSSSISVTEAWLTFLFLVLASALAFRSLVPPAAVPVSAPTNEFSAERAFKHLEFIAREPHPTGSAANARVRDYLIDQLKSMGLEPKVQQAVAATSWDIGGAPYGSGVVQNVIGLSRGTNSTGTVLLMAHYDSVQTGPGAGDNGSGVVTLLETLRALQSSAPLRNNVLFVFSEGEEDGGLGSQAFVDEHPLAKDVSVAIVPDSNGCGRAAIGVFDRHNGWLVREIAGAVPRPLAASISDEVGKLAGGYAMGDHLSFYQKGVPVLGLGAGGCQTGYHTAEDKLGNIDLRTLQDLGNCAVPLTRKFGNADLKDIRPDDLIYFPLLGYMIFYSAKWVLPLTVVTLVGLIGVVLVGLKRKILTGRGLTLSFLLWAIGMIAASASIAFLWRVLRSLHKVNSSFTSAYNAQLYAIAFVALVAAMVSALYSALRERIGTQNFAAGAALFCGALMLVTYVFTPAGTYLLMWPLLLVLFPLGFAFALSQGDSAPLRAVKLFGAILAIACLFR